jgi:ATP-dependent Clp protease protease subunit
MKRLSTGLLTGRGRQRSVELRGRVTKSIASCCIARLLVLASDAPGQPIAMHIDSPGGSLAESLAIISTINGIRCPVVTFCRGRVGGTAAVIAAHGLNGLRIATSETVFSLKLLNETGKWQVGPSNTPLPQLFADILAKGTGKPEAKCLEWLTRGIEFTAEAAVKNGLIDKIGVQPVFPKAL